MSTRTSLRQRGEAMRQRLFGDDDGVPAVLRTLNMEASYGAIWSRPGLAKTLAAQNKPQHHRP